MAVVSLLQINMTRVYLFRGKHPLYETFVANPPDGVEYFPRIAERSTQEYTLYSSRNSLFRHVIDDAFGLMHVPRCVPILGRYDLVHSGRGFIVVGPNKYVVDVEHASSFVGMHHERLKSSRLRSLTSKILNSPRCCQILPWCEAALKSLSIVSSDPIMSKKSRVLYPAVDIEAFPVRQTQTVNPVVLFMGEYYWKGGREFLQACMNLSTEQDFEVIYISLRVHPPDSVLRRARESLNIEYHQGPVPRSELLDRIYPSADIFVMPTYIDTFGYAFLEAMSYGIPCIGTDHFAVPEIIENDVSGIVVNTPVSYFDQRFVGHPNIRIEETDCSQVVMELTSAIGRLLDSASLRNAMGTEGKRQVMNGKFSIGRRNRILKDVYEGCSHR